MDADDRTDCLAIRNQKKKRQDRVSRFKTLSVWRRSTKEKSATKTFLLIDRRPNWATRCHLKALHGLHGNGSIIQKMLSRSAAGRE